MRYSARRQMNEMSGQPDLIIQLAKHIAADFQQRGFGAVEVRAEALDSVNGGAPALMIDPQVDLTQVEDSPAIAHWITTAPEGPPITLTPIVQRSPTPATEVAGL